MYISCMTSDLSLFLNSVVMPRCYALDVSACACASAVRPAGRPGPGRNSEKCPLVASIGLKGKNEYAHDLNGENLEGVF